MDIYCRRCGEPWDHDTLHEVAETEKRTYEEVAVAFRKRGCAALGSKCNPMLVADKRIGMIYDTVDGDMDFAAILMTEN